MSYAVRAYDTGERLPIHLNRVFCNGSERQLSECDGLLNINGTYRCLFTEAAAICTGKKWVCYVLYFNYKQLHIQLQFVRKEAFD